MSKNKGRQAPNTVSSAAPTQAPSASSTAAGTSAGKKQQLRELQERQEKTRRRNVIIFLVALAAALSIGFWALGQWTRTPLPGITKSEKLAPVGADDSSRAWGPKGAPITIVEFLDYQCPACGQFANSQEEEIVRNFAPAGKVRYEVRYFNIIDQRLRGRESLDAGQAAMCAGEQGKFWLMHNTIFRNQYQEGVGNLGKVRLKLMAATLDGIDQGAFDSCLDSNKFEATIRQDQNEVQTRGVNSTPTFFINGNRFTGGIPTAPALRAEFARIAPNVKFE